jgi:hypothetical protein
MLDTERQYFDQNHQELLRQYPGKFIIIKEQQVRGPFDTIQDALGAAATEFGLSSVLIRRTDEQPNDVSIPVLTLGILRANPPHPTGRPGENPGR